MHDRCDKPFLLVLCDHLDLDFWPISKSNLLPGGQPQFFEFACYVTIPCDLQDVLLKTAWTGFNLLPNSAFVMVFLCPLQSTVAHRDNIVCCVCLSVSLFVRPSVRSHTFLVVTYIYVLQVTHALLGMLLLFFLACRDECPESYCRTPGVDVGVRMHKNFNLAYNSWTTIGRAFIFHMCIPCDKTFPWVPKYLT